MALTAQQTQTFTAGAGSVAEASGEASSTSSSGSSEEGKGPVMEVDRPDAVSGAAQTEAEMIAAAKAAEKKRLLEEARDVVERSLGECLRKKDIDDEAAGAEL